MGKLKESRDRSEADRRWTTRRPSGQSAPVTTTDTRSVRGSAVSSGASIAVMTGTLLPVDHPDHRAGPDRRHRGAGRRLAFVADDVPRPFDFGSGDGDDPFGKMFGGMFGGMFGDMMKMFQGQGPIQWDTARQIAQLQYFLNHVLSILILVI